MAGRQVTIEFLGNSRNLVGAINSAESRTSRLGSTLKRIGKSAAIGFAGAAIVAGKALWEMGEAAAADEASAAQLARQLKNNTKITDAGVAAVEDWILATSLASGVADDDLRPALSRLATATGDVEQAQKLLKLGMDISAGTGKDLKTVTEALAKAQNGSLGGLSRLGVKIKDAAGETKSFTAIQDDLAKKFKGATSQAADTTAGKMARLKVQMAETGEAIGYKLLPYALRFANWMLNSGIPAVQKISGWLKDKLGPAMSAVVDWFKKGSKSGGDVSNAMDDLSVFVDDCKRAFKALSPLVAEIARIYFPILIEQAKQTAKNLRWLGEAGIWLWNNALGPSMKAATKGFSLLLQGIGQTLKLLGSIPGAPKWIGKTADKAIGAAKALNKISDSIHNIPDHKDVKINVVTVFSHQGRPTQQGGDPADQIPGKTPRVASKGKGGQGVNVGAAALDMMAQVIAGIEGKKKKLQDVLAGVRDAINTAKDNIASILEDKRSWAEGFKDFLGSVFADDFTDADTGAYTGTVDKIIAAQQDKLAKALQLQSDIKSLIDKGLSADLLNQLQAAGASGMAQIHTLASGTAADIGRLNSLNAQTAGALGGAGTAASNVVFKDQLQVANQQLNQLQAVNTSLLEIASHVKKGEIAEVRLDGSTLVVIMRREEKKTGRKLLVTPA